MLRLKAQSDGVGLVESGLGSILQLERWEHVLRLVERLQSFPVEDVLVGDLLAGWSCHLSLRLRRYPGRVARSRLLELLLSRRQLLSWDASSHVDILLYFLNAHRLMELFLCRLIS